MNLTTKMGLPMTLTCQPLGDSPIRIKWSLDGNPVEFTSSRYFYINLIINIFFFKKINILIIMVGTVTAVLWYLSLTFST